MEELECKHNNWTSKEYGHIQGSHIDCDMYEVYCMDCEEYIHTITKEIIPHQINSSLIK